MLPQKELEYYYQLAHKWSLGRLTEEERQILDNWYAAQPEADVNVPASLAGSEEEHAALLFLKIKGSIEAGKEEPEQPPARLTRWWWAAASILLLAGTLVYLNRPKPQHAIAVLPKPVQDVLPGKDGAILTLGDGAVVVLDSLQNGWSAEQDQSTVHLKAGRLQYNQQHNKTAAGSNGQVFRNTLSTPRGRQFSLVLPDGTIAWLNAASSISFPTAFTGKTREVSVTGEVYFEVSKHNNGKTAVPFRVSVNDKYAVEVLGTNFNINAYPDEKVVRTTLLEGVVRVNTATQTALLKPGQQASAGSNDLLTVDRANTSQAVAWKNGLFYFSERTGIREVMRQIERWYDVQVIYEPGTENVVFTGEMQRNLTLLQVIKGLDNMGVRYRLEGKVLRVSPAS
ncbi:FecR family protein [Filimonas effusa]|uniref:FecR family protein n=1 Tax=Filimonas effusa TaxID=2508721 RepID=A0A4Q1D5A3_9BACT|nr:FecR family protein [Filimonas effusa]RXK83136.1 FecR family protein [Filimonas effusa]